MTVLITFDNNCFYLTTDTTTYILEITKFGHLEHIYYGPRIEKQVSLDALRYKRSIMLGSCVNYDTSDDVYCLDNIPLEWSGIGRGDFRQSPLSLKMPDNTYVHDFIYHSHRIEKGSKNMALLPSAYGSEHAAQTLIVVLLDTSSNITLEMIYTVYEKTNIITRRSVLLNTTEHRLVIDRMMSMMIDIPNRNLQLSTFDGNWIKEAHIHTRAISHGIHTNCSTTGASSNKHNPGIILSQKRANQSCGWVYGFNLVYSGNHVSSVELNSHDLVRVSMGINDYCFAWELAPGKQFETPEVVMSFSDQGFNGLSHNMHDFINDHIVRSDWKHRERPVLLNNWEAHFFDFNEAKLIRLAKQSKAVGIEMFVLDDGWFSNRNSDNAGLGDYHVNSKKLKHGITSFVKKINKLGLQCGLWFEPEMVNVDSDLYRKHPQYALTIPTKHHTYGRNQLVLNLCMKEVQDYIVESISQILDEANITYVKWDMNRHISEFFSANLENQGMFYHSYVLGLYSILDRIFTPRPHILLESCSSGGNRFDLGMLCFSPQIWASDNTDPIERLNIQEGLSYLYPPSTMGAHVSASPHQQTLRHTPLSTRFNVAAFGCLGYELDLKYLSKVEKKEIAGQIAFYKEHRKTLQFGTMSRFDLDKTNKVQFQMMSQDESCVITGYFQTLTTANEGYDYLCIKGLQPNASYVVTTKPQQLYLEQFGELVKHLLPVELNPNGAILRTANKYYALQDCQETYTGTGNVFKSGILLNNQFMGTGHNKNVRVLGDFGSNLYVTHLIKSVKDGGFNQ